MLMTPVGVGVGVTPVTVPGVPTGPELIVTHLEEVKDLKCMPFCVAHSVAGPSITPHGPTVRASAAVHGSLNT